MKFLKKIYRDVSRTNEVIETVYELCDNAYLGDIKIEYYHIELIQGMVMVYITNKLQEDMIDNRECYNALLYEYLTGDTGFYISPIKYQFGKSDGCYYSCIGYDSDFEHDHKVHTLDISRDRPYDDGKDYSDEEEDEYIGTVILDIRYGEMKIKVRNLIDLMPKVVEVIETLNSSRNTKSARKN